MPELTINFLGVHPKESKHTNAALKEMLPWINLLKMSELSDFQKFILIYVEKENGGFYIELARRVKFALENETHQLRGTEILANCTPQGVTISTQLAFLEEAFNSLTDFLKDFLVYLEARRDKSMYHRLLIKRLLAQNHKALFLETTKRYQKLLRNLPSTILSANDQWWLDHQLYYNHFNDHTLTYKDTFYNNLDTYYALDCLVVLRNYLEMLNLNLVVNQKDLTWLKTKLKAIQENPGHTNPTIILYLQLIELLEAKENLLSITEKFETQFLGFTEIKPKKIAPVDQLVLIKTLTNFLALTQDPELLKSNSKKLFFWLNYLGINEIYLETKTMSDGDYLNFFMVARSIKRFADFEVFKKKHRAHLNPDIIPLIDGLCSAFMAFDHAEIKKAIKILDKVFPSRSQEELKYNLRAKGLRLMASLELVLIGDKDGVELYEKAQENFNKFCNRLVQKKHYTKEGLITQYKFHENVGYLYKFVTSPAGTKESEKNKEKFIANLQPKTNIAYHTWLFNKAQQLKLLA